MLQKLIMYAALVAIPVAGYLGYDYGIAKEKQRQQSAADALTDKSTDIADTNETTTQTVKVVYRDIVRTVEVASDPTACLDKHPGPDVAAGITRLRERDTQSR